MVWRVISVVCVCAVVRTQVIPGKSRTNDGDYNTVNTDGSFDFGYANKDRGSSYHLAHGSSTGVVGGRFGAKDPATNTIKETVYTAGPRGFRAKGPNVHRKMDLDQRPRGPIGNKDDPYFDPNEDPSYAFKFNTRTYSKNENADSRGDVKGHYSFVDDVGERHDVSYIAGRDTGFHVSSAVPDNPSIIGAPFHRAPLVRGESKPRGRTAVQRGLDGSYRFISAGPDQRRTESSDSHGNVRGSYTFLDDKGVQRTVHYIAGPGIGYRIVKNGQDPYIPAYFPTIPSAYDPDFVSAGSTAAFASDDTGADDVFKGPEGTAASGHVKPPPFPEKDRPNKKPSNQPSGSEENTSDEGNFNQGSGNSGSSNFGPDSGESGYGQGSGSTGSGSSYGGPTASPSRPTFSQGSGQGASGSSLGSSGSYPANGDESYVDEEGVYGKPNKGSGKPRPNRPRPRPGKPFRPTKKPYVPIKPSQNKDDEDDKETPEFAIGFDIQHKPGPGGNLKPGTTIIRNIGQDYFGVPPGVSVRAHVQSIDLYPYESKPITPAEAIEKDKT